MDMFIRQMAVKTDRQRQTKSNTIYTQLTYASSVWWDVKPCSMYLTHSSHVCYIYNFIHLKGSVHNNTNVQTIN